MSKDIKDHIYNVLLERDEKGDTLLSREVARHIDDRTAEIIKTMTFRFGMSVAGIFVTVAGSWFGLYYQVQEQERRINVVDGSFSRDEIEVRFSSLDAQVLQLRADLNSDVTEIKADIKDIRNAVINNN